MFDMTETPVDPVRAQMLSGIWGFGPRDVIEESRKLYSAADVLVRGISNLVGGMPVCIPEIPRRSGMQVLPFYYAADLAQALRFARNEGDISSEYLQEIGDTLAKILGTRVVDLVDLDGFSVRAASIPTPAFDLETIAHRPVAQILLAARGRLALNAGKPVSETLASALTGMPPKRIAAHVDRESGRKMQKRKRKNGVSFNAETLDLLVREIESVYFSGDYRPF